MARKGAEELGGADSGWVLQSHARPNLPLFQESEDRRFWAFIARESRYAVARMARSLNVTDRHLQRHFRRYAACPPKEWMTAERMIAARKLLLSHSSIKEVAFDLRYRQVSHFCREFKLFYGKTPLEYLATARSACVPHLSRCSGPPLSHLDN